MVLGASLLCNACLFPEEDNTKAGPAPNVIGCACAWKSGTKGQYEKAKGELTCEGPWTEGTSNFETEKNAAADECLALAKVKAGTNGPSYNCLCACDPSYVATGTLSTKMTCK